MKNAGLIFLAMLMIITGGIYSSSQMKLEEMPNVDIPYLQVIIVYPGATPEQALDDVGKPLEQALTGINNMKNFFVSAGSNYVASTIEFDLKQPMEDAIKDVNSVLATLKLPEGAQKPQVSKEGPTAAPIYSFSLTGDSDQATIQQYVNDHIKPSFSTIQGISSIDVQGTSAKKIFIKVDPEKLQKENLTMDKLKQTLLANNISVPAGQITVDQKSLNVQISKKLNSLDDIKKLNLIIIDQDMSGLTNAFTNIGEGFGTVGTTVNQLGKGIGNLATGQALLQAEIQVMQGINSLSNQWLADQATLTALEEQVRSNPQQKAALEAQINSLRQKVAQEQAQITNLQTKLTSLQEQVQASGLDLATGLDNLSKSSSTVDKQGQEESVSGKPALRIRTIPLSDIADVTHTSGKETTLTRLNGKPAVVVDIKTQPGTNTVEIVNQLKQKLTNQDLYKVTPLHDSSIQVKKSVNGMLREALLGALFTVIVTFLFLQNLRSTLVAILSIPLSIFASLIVLYSLGYSLNLMTLAGMAVAIGRVVDDSIVVIENVYRRIRTSEKRNSDLVLEATKEVGKAVTFSTIATIAVFGPLSVVPGIVGKFFVPFGITVVIALLFSLIVAISVVPLLARLFLLDIKHHVHKESGLQRFYRTLLGWTLNHKLIVTCLTLAIFIGTLGLIPKIPQNFMPAEKTVSYALNVSLPVGTSTEKADQTAKIIEKVLFERSDVQNYQTRVSGEQITMKIELEEGVSETATQEFQKKLRETTDGLGTGINSALSPIGMTSYGGLFIVVNGTELEVLKAASNTIVQAIKGVPGLADVHTNVSAVRPQLSLDINPEAAAKNALYPAMIAMSVREMISGDSVMNVSLDGRSTEVNLGLAVDDLNTLKFFSQQKVTNMLGEQVKLADVATIHEKPGPTSIQRLNQQEYVSVNGQFITDNSSAVQKEVEQRLKTLQLPDNVTYNFEGETKAMGEGFKNMAIAMAVAILLVYIVMMVGFGEMIAPISILFSLPFIFVGGLWGLFFTHEALGMPALVGFLMLIGIVVTNAIVFMDRAMQNIVSGLDTRTALIEAGVTRIRPILMTAVATIGALLPLAVSSEGGLVSRSMAIVVIAGLSTSTILTLVIVPMAYQVLDSLRKKLIFKRLSD